MIRLIEEPVAYGFVKDIEVLDNVAYWVYKNPTANEIGELFDTGRRGFRGLLCGDDYYIASAYHFIHNDISKVLYDITKLNLSQYDNQIYIKTDKGYNYMSVYNRVIDKDSFIKIIQSMFDVGLIKSDTKVQLEEDYQIEDRDYPTVEELLGGDIP